MTRSIWLRLLLAALLLPVLAGHTPAREPKKGETYAFLVACSDYSKAEFTTLPHTVAEMKEFRQTLLDTRVREVNIKFLHDTAERRFLSEKDKIDKELDLLLRRVGERDTVIVVLNGHGLHLEGEEVSYFLPVDARLEGRKNFLPLTGKGGVYERLEKSNAGRKLLLVNACRNDVVAPRSLAATRVTIDKKKKDVVPKGIAALFSCQPSEKSYYYPDGKGPKEVKERSVFFHHLIEAWRGTYASDDQVTLDHVFDQVQRRTAADADNILGESQNPEPVRGYRNVWVVNDQVYREPDAATIAAFEKLGGAYGVITRAAPGDRWFVEGKRDTRARGLPGFSLYRCNDSDLADLPRMDVRFGLEFERGVKVGYAGRPGLSNASLKHLARFKQLQALLLGDHEEVNDAGLKHLAGLEQLQVLDLHLTGVGDAGLKHLVKLERLQWLNLRYTRVGDAGLKHLAELKQLQLLNLQYTEVSDAGLKHLAELKQLQWLNLCYTRVTDAGLAQLAGLKQLQALNLRGTKVTAEGVAKLQKALPDTKITR